MTDNRTTELLPCPFCGGEAELKLYQNGDWQIICYHADGCIMRESDLSDCYWESVQTLARQWNTRADYHGYEHAAIEAWESIKAWNTRAELGSGTLTAEQVREAIKQHSVEIQPELGYGEFVRCFHGKSWQAIADELNAELVSGTKPCYAADENYKRCKYSVNRGWCDDAPFLVWDDAGHLFITMGGLKTWDVTDDAKIWFSKLGSGTCSIVKTWSDSDYVDDWRYRCSECGCKIPVNERDPETGDVINAANYCPNCGRKVVSE